MKAQPLVGLGPTRDGQIGNPPHEITQENRDKVRLLAGVASQDVVAARIGFSVETLRRYYNDDYKEGQRDAIVDVKAKVLTQALEGNMNAAKVYLAMKGELKRQHEFSGPGGGPIRTVDYSALLEGKSEEELRALDHAISLLTAAGAGAGPGAGAPAPAAGPGEAQPD